MKTDLYKNLTRSKSKKTTVPSKAGNWLTNVGKSMGYASIDVLNDIIPNTIETANTAKEAVQQIRDDIIDYKVNKGRTNALFENNIYADIGKTFIKNSLDDLKSGNIYNKQRMDTFDDDGFDMGDMGFDDDFDLGDDTDYSTSVSSDDNSTTVGVQKTSSKGNDYSVVNINTNLNADNPMVKAISKQTISSNVQTQAMLDMMKSQHIFNTQQFKMFGDDALVAMRGINDNLGTVITTLSDSVVKQSSLAIKYYDDSMGAFTQMVSFLEIISTNTTAGDPNTNKQTKEYKDVVDDLINSGGSLNIANYKDFVLKNIDTMTDSNLFVSPIKAILKDTDSLKEMIKNPLGSIMTSTFKGLLTTTLQQAAKSFDDMLGETMVAGLYQLRGMGNRSDNPAIKFIAEAFGLSNKIKTTVDKTNYEKGTVPWNGISHRTLNDVIPFYLRKILSAVSGTDEVAFDYNKGIYRTVGDIQKEEKRNRDFRLRSELSYLDTDFKDFISTNFKFDNNKQKETVTDEFNKFLEEMVLSDGGLSFRNYKDSSGDEVNDIADKLGRNITDPIVQLIKGFFEGSDHGYIARAFGRDALSARTRYSKYMQDVESNPIKYNTQLMDTGLDQGKLFKYDEKGELKQVENTSILGKAADKYDKSTNDYLRDILTVLLHGLKTFPQPVSTNHVDPLIGPPTPPSLNSLTGDNSVYDPTNFYKKYENDMKAQETKVKNDQAAIDEWRRGRDMTQEEIESAQIRGIQVIDTADQSSDAVNSEQIAKIRTAQVQKEKDEEFKNRDDMVGKLLGNNSFANIVRHINDTLKRPAEVLTKVFKKADDFLFSLVFGKSDSEKEGSLFITGLAYIKQTFEKFSTWMSERVIDPMKEALFGDEGVFTQFKKTKFYEDMKGYATVFKNYLFGTKNAMGGHSGGLFSGYVNAMKDMVKNVGQHITGKDYTDSTGKVHKSKGDSIFTSFKKFIFGDNVSVDKDGKINFKDSVDNLWSELKNRGSSFMDMIFGPSKMKDGSKNQRRADTKAFMGEMKASMPKSLAFATVGAGAAFLAAPNVGLLAGFFLPGGPIGGALLGLGAGIVSQSESLKTFLFGDKVDGERQGNIVRKETIDFFKSHGKGLLAGFTLPILGNMGFLPSFFLPGGPITGALIGGATSMVLKNKEFMNFMFGERDKYGNVLSRGIFGTARKMLPDDVNLKSKFIDAGIGAGVGVLGSFFLPGGPMLGAMLGATTGFLSATDGFKTLLFGEYDPDEERRKGGLFGKFKDFMGDKVFGPMVKKFQKFQLKTLEFMETQIAIPLKLAMMPITHQIKKVTDYIKNGVKKGFGTIGKVLMKGVVNPIVKTVDFAIVKPLMTFRNLMNKLVFGTIKAVAAAPFKLLGMVGESLFKKHKKQGLKAEKTNTRDVLFGTVRNMFTKQGRAAMKEDGISVGAALGEFMKTRFTPSGRKAAKFGPSGAVYGEKYEDLKKNELNRIRDKYAQKYAEIDSGKYGVKGFKYVPNPTEPENPQTEALTTIAENQVMFADTMLEPINSMDNNIIKILNFLENGNTESKEGNGFKVPTNPEGTSTINDTTVPTFNTESLGFGDGGDMFKIPGTLSVGNEYDSKIGTTNVSNKYGESVDQHYTALDLANKQQETRIKEADEAKSKKEQAEKDRAEVTDRTYDSMFNSSDEGESAPTGIAATLKSGMVDFMESDGKMGKIAKWALGLFVGGPLLAGAVALLVQNIKPLLSKFFKWTTDVALPTLGGWISTGFNWVIDKGIPMLGSAIGTALNFVIEKLPEIITSVVTGAKNLWDKTIQGDSESTTRQDGIQEAATGYVVKKTGKFVDIGSKATVKVLKKSYAKGGKLGTSAVEAGGKFLTKTGLKEATEMTMDYAIDNAAGKTGGRATKALAKGANQGAKIIAESAAQSSDNIINKFFKHIDTVLVGIFRNKAVRLMIGGKVCDDIIVSLAKLFDEATVFITKQFTKFAAKLGLAITEDAASFIPIVGQIIDVLMILWDAGSGAAEAQRIFKVNKKDVTLGMRMAAGVSKATIGFSACVDFLSEILRIMTQGTGLVELLAEIIYRGVCLFGGMFGVGKDSIEKLDENQEKFRKEHEAYNKMLIEEGKDPIDMVDYNDRVNPTTFTKFFNSKVSVPETKNTTSTQTIPTSAAAYGAYNTQPAQSTYVGSSYAAASGAYNNTSTNTSYSYAAGRGEGNIFSNMGTGPSLNDLSNLSTMEMMQQGAKNFKTETKVPIPYKNANGDTEYNWVTYDPNSTDQPFMMKNGQMVANPKYVEKPGSFNNAPSFMQAPQNNQTTKNNTSTPANYNNSSSLTSNYVPPQFRDQQNQQTEIVNNLNTNDMLNGFVYYRQGDDRWKANEFGSDNIGASGCGATSMAMALSQITGKNIFPSEIAEYMVANNLESSGGTNWEALPLVASKYGVSVRAMTRSKGDWFKGTSDQTKVVEALSAGQPVVLSGNNHNGSNRSAFTKGGHLVVATGLDSTGTQIMINDPRGEKYSGYYSLDDVMGQTKAAWAYTDYNGQPITSTTQIGNDSYTQAEGNSPFGGMFSIFNDIGELMKNTMGKFLYGSDWVSGSSLFGGNSSSSSAEGTIGPATTTTSSTLRGAMAQKVAELVFKNETGNDFTSVAPDVQASTGKKLSPSIGAAQWRGSYAKHIVDETLKRAPNDSDARFIKSIDFNSDAPWSNDKISRLKSFFQRNLDVTAEVQRAKMATDADQRLLQAVYDSQGDTILNDPRSIVMLAEMAQTGPGNVKTFLHGSSNYPNPYRRGVPAGMDRFDHFYSEMQRPDASLWGKTYKKYYKNRYKNDYEALKNWEPKVTYADSPNKYIKSEDASSMKFDHEIVTMDKGGEPEINMSKKLDIREILNTSMGRGSDMPATATNTFKFDKPDYDALLESNKTVEKFMTAENLNGLDNTNRLVDVLNSILGEIKTTNKGISNIGSSQQVANNSTNNILVTDNGNSFTNNQSQNHFDTKAQYPRTKPVDHSNEYNMAKRIAKGVQMM